MAGEVWRNWFIDDREGKGDGLDRNALGPRDGSEFVH